MVLSHTPEEKSRFVNLSTQAKVGPASVYLHNEVGYNYRMSNIVAAILCAQIENLQEKIKMKHSIYSRYDLALNGVFGCQMLPVPNDRVSNYWMSCLITDDNTGELVKFIIDRLDENDIQARRVWTPLHTQHVFHGSAFVTANEERPNSVDFFNRALCIPSDTNMTAEEQNHVIGVIQDAILDFKKGVH